MKDDSRIDFVMIPRYPGESEVTYADRKRRMLAALAALRPARGDFAIQAPAVKVSV